MLQLSPTIRDPRPDEIPNYDAKDGLLEARKAAKIVEGYTLKYNTSNEFPFKFYAEANIDNYRMWSLFETLASQLPDEVSCIYGRNDDEPIYGKYMDKTLVMEQLKLYETELTQDCFIEFGLIYHTQEELKEVFIAESKYLKVWGSEETNFKDTMTHFGLKEIHDLNFIDEFPKVVEPLISFNSSVKETYLIIEELNQFFK